MLDYPKALRSAGVALLLCLAWFGGWILVLWAVLRTSGNYDPYFWINAAFCVGAFLSFFVMIRGLLRRKPHITYASFHAICWMAFFWLAALSNTTWLLFGALVCSIILFVFLQPILTLLSKIQIVVHSAPKGAGQDSATYEQEYQTMQPGFTRPGEMHQKTDFGRYYPKE